MEVTISDLPVEAIIFIRWLADQIKDIDESDLSEIMRQISSVVQEFQDR